MLFSRMPKWQGRKVSSSWSRLSSADKRAAVKAWRGFQATATRSYRSSPGGSNTKEAIGAAATSSRAARILQRLPPSMQKYTRGLQRAPVSHVVAFLLLHEITAMVPLLGLVGLFHYTDWAPMDYMMGHYGAAVAEGVQRFERYFRRKGWLGSGDDDTAMETTEAATETEATAAEAVLQRWASSDTKFRLVVEIGLAYAITKALLPVRVVASLWATPWFASVLARGRTVLGTLGRK